MFINRSVLVSIGGLLILALVVSCGTSDDVTGSDPESNPGTVVLDTIAEPIIPVADGANKTLVFDLSAIDEVVDGKLEDIIVSYYAGGIELSFLSYHTDIQAWVLLNEVEPQIIIGDGLAFKHGFSEQGLVADDYLDADNIISLKVNDMYVAFSDRFENIVKAYVVVRTDKV